MGLLVQHLITLIIVIGVLILVFLDSGSSGFCCHKQGLDPIPVLILVFLDSGSSGLSKSNMIRATKRS